MASLKNGKKNSAKNEDIKLKNQSVDAGEHLLFDVNGDSIDSAIENQVRAEGDDKVEKTSNTKTNQADTAKSDLASKPEEESEGYEKAMELFKQGSYGLYSDEGKEGKTEEVKDEGLDVSALAEEYNKTKQVKVKKTRPQKEPKAKGKKRIRDKKGHKHRMRTLGVLVVLGIFTGSGLGVWYFNDVLRSDVNYNQYDISEYITTASEVLSEVYGLSESQQRNWLEVAKASDKNSPDDLTAVQSFILAEYNATLAERFHAEGNGRVATIATQSVYSEKNYDGNRYTFESISKGMMSVAICSAMDKGDDRVELYRGSNIQPDDAEWSLSDDDVYSLDAYEGLAGSTPDAIQPYIISDKTVLSSSIERDEETGYYTLTFELDPITSVLRYARQVRQTSGLSSYPEFKTVSQTITIDENWNLICIDVHETYSVVAFGIPASCTGTLTTYYYFNDDAVLDLPV